MLQLLFVCLRDEEKPSGNRKLLIESGTYCMRRNRTLDKNHVVVACLFAVCIFLIIIIFMVSGGVLPAGADAAAMVTKEEVAEAYAFLDQKEAVQAALEAVDGPITYGDYEDFLEQLHLWEAGGLEQLLSGEAGEYVSPSALAESRDRIAELFEADMMQEELPPEKEPGKTPGMPKVDEATMIRVLLLQENEPLAQELYFSANETYTITWHDKTKTKEKNKVIRAGLLKLAVGERAYVGSENGQVYLAGETGERATLGYSGRFVITRHADGYSIVNEVPIEQYLYGVVQSEMPAYFEKEALKAQAVCARTYIVAQLMKDNYPQYGADVDDSVRYQAYNKTAPDERVVAAVNATKGQILARNDLPIGAYFFSTSHGMTSGTEIWELEECEYLRPVRGNADGKAEDLSDEEAFRTYIEQTDESDYDYASNYYRWKAVLDLSSHGDEAAELLKKIRKTHPECVIIEDSEGNRAGSAALDELGEAEQMEVLERSYSGAAQRLRISFPGGSVTISNENYIRQVLGVWMDTLQYKDGSSAPAGGMLPSVYFYVQPVKEGIVLFGGGLGHGIGMSQYGANGMAKKGKKMEKILSFYYRDVKLSRLYGGA